MGDTRDDRNGTSVKGGQLPEGPVNNSIKPISTPPEPNHNASLRPIYTIPLPGGDE